MKGWSEHKIKPIFELRTLENPMVDRIYELYFLNFFILWSYRLIEGQLASSRALWVVIYSPASEIEQWKESISIHIIINVRPSFFHTKAFVYKSLAICLSMIILFHHTV